MGISRNHKVMWLRFLKKCSPNTKTMNHSRQELLNEVVVRADKKRKGGSYFEGKLDR